MNYTRPSYRNKILLVLIMLLGSVLRLYGLNWDDSHHLHPDERFVVLTSLNITWPDSFSDYLNPETSTLSPYNTENYKSYIYGTFPLFLTKALADVFHYDAYGKLHIVGRLLSTLFDLGSLLLIYFIARKTFSRHTGILAAAFYAVTVLPIQQSHFFTVDNFLVFWILVTFSLLIIFMERENFRALVISSLMGVSFAFALASKISAILFTTIIAFALAIKFVQVLQKVSWQKSIFQFISNSIVFLIS
ncbi:MAG: glycosyltransferase family 39 protein, partial [Deltaproteobacteria bacterium]|nr:glycosyltransferase family 39 protein [Deltaproteobacteria bacterium]